MDDRHDDPNRPRIVRYDDPTEPVAVDAWEALDGEAARRAAVAAEITTYAEAMAGTLDDYDPAIEAAGLEVWLQNDEWDD